MRAPSNSPVTLPFGATTDPYTKDNPHKGVDFAYIPDNHIYAPFSGRVTQYPLNGNDGNGTYMTDDQGRFHGMLHASKYLVSNGSVVSEGQPIAIMGDTGAAQGVHLHWAVKQNGQFIDPLSILKPGQGAINDMIPTKDLLNSLFRNYRGREASPEEQDLYVGKIKYDDLIPVLEAGDEHNIHADLQYNLNVAQAQIKTLQTALQDKTGFTPVTEQLYKKK